MKKLLAGASILCLTYEYLPVFILNKFRFDYHLMRGNQDSGKLVLLFCEDPYEFCEDHDEFCLFQYYSIV